MKTKFAPTKMALAGAVLAVFALTSAPTASAQETLAATCPPPRDNPGPAVMGATVRLGQTFIPTLSGPLTRAELDVTKQAATNGDWVVEIRTVQPSDDAAGEFEPTSTILASTTVPNSSVPAGDSILNAVFATPAAVVASQRYALVIGRPGAATQFEGGVGFRDNPCSEVAWSSGDGGTTWFLAEGTPTPDLVFSVFVTPPVPPDITPPGNPTSPINPAGNTRKRKCKKKQKAAGAEIAKKKKCKKKKR